MGGPKFGWFTRRPSDAARQGFRVETDPDFYPLFADLDDLPDPRL
jgi:hypothetical protein